MSKFVKIFRQCLDYDLITLIKEIDDLHPLDTYLPDYAGDYPQAPTKHKVITNLPPRIKEAIERTICHPLTDWFYLWNWDGATYTLERHTDPIFKPSFGVRVHISVFVCLDGPSELNFHDSSGKIIETHTYKPGDIIVINNTQIEHSGYLLAGEKRTLCGYLYTPQFNEIEERGEDLPMIDVDRLFNE